MTKLALLPMSPQSLMTRFRIARRLGQVSVVSETGSDVDASARLPPVDNFRVNGRRQRYAQPGLFRLFQSRHGE
jgi:hypothetical protein